MNTTNYAEIDVRIGKPEQLFWRSPSHARAMAGIFPLMGDVLVGILNTDGRWFSELDRLIWESTAGIGLNRPMRYGRYPEGGFASSFHQKVGEMDSADVASQRGKAIFVPGVDAATSVAFRHVSWGIIEEPDDIRTALASAILKGVNHASASQPQLIYPWYGSSQTATGAIGETHSERVMMAQHLTLLQVQGLQLASRQLEMPMKLTVLLSPKEEREIDWMQEFARAADITHLDDFSQLTYSESL